MLRSLTRVMDLFQKWDYDRSGSVDKKEFAIALRELGFNAPKQAVHQLFDEMDVDRSGHIEFGELNAKLRQGAAIKLAAKLMPRLSAVRNL